MYPVFTYIFSYNELRGIGSGWNGWISNMDDLRKFSQMTKPDNLTDALGLTHLRSCPVTFLYQYQILEEFDSPLPRAGST